MIEVIGEIKKLLEDNNIEFWLDCGALLHLYRDKTMDRDDIDFCLMMSEYDKTLALVKELIKTPDICKLRVIWDKEISIRYKEIQFDFIFCEIKEEILYIYSYRKNAEDTKATCWNIEWRAKYPAEVYFPLKEIVYNDLIFKVPNQIEKKLEIHYGQDWRIPKNCSGWEYEMSLNKDENYKPIAVCITTFLRDEIIKKCLPSYDRFNLKIYLIDQGNRANEKEKFYDIYRNKGHIIEYSDFDIGLSAARNIILSKIIEPLVIISEDDIELLSNPYNLISYFDKDKNLGIIGGLPITQPSGKQERYNYELDFNNGILHYKKSQKLDIVENFFIARRKLFDDVKYDDKLKICEHTDFFLQLKQLNKWNIIQTDDLKGNHYPIRTSDYNKYRSRGEYEIQFKNKWGIKNVRK
jgi:hypothetical protein